jgi:hypothetical protein
MALHFGFGPPGTRITVGQFLWDLVATQVWLAIPVGLLAASPSVWNAERPADGAEWSPFGRKPRVGQDALLVLDEFSAFASGVDSAINLAERVRDVGVHGGCVIGWRVAGWAEGPSAGSAPALSRCRRRSSPPTARAARPG